MATLETASRRSLAKYAAILRAATEVFLREGYTRASVDAIAEAAGVGKQTVYGHFGDKERLFLAVVKHARATSGCDSDRLITDTGDPRADLEAAATWVIRAVTAPDVMALHRLTIAELPYHPELQRSWRDDGTAQAIINVIAGYLTACDERGTLAVHEPAITARQFIMLLSVEAQVRSLRGIEPLAPHQITEIVTDTVDLILRAHLSPPQATGGGARPNSRRGRPNETIADRITRPPKAGKTERRRQK